MECIFDQLQIKKQIGKGITSRVYKARFKNTKYTYAVKEIGLNSWYSLMCATREKVIKLDNENLLLYKCVYVGERPFEIENVWDGEESRPGSAVYEEDVEDQSEWNKKLSILRDESTMNYNTNFFEQDFALEQGAKSTKNSKIGFFLCTSHEKCRETLYDLLKSYYKNKQKYINATNSKVYEEISAKISKSIVPFENYQSDDEKTYHTYLNDVKKDSDKNMHSKSDTEFKHVDTKVMSMKVRRADEPKIHPLCLPLQIQKDIFSELYQECNEKYNYFDDCKSNALQSKSEENFRHSIDKIHHSFGDVIGCEKGKSDEKKVIEANMVLCDKYTAQKDDADCKQQDINGPNFTTLKTKGGVIEMEDLCKKNATGNNKGANIDKTKRSNEDKRLIQQIKKSLKGTNYSDQGLVQNVVPYEPTNTSLDFFYNKTSDNIDTFTILYDQYGDLLFDNIKHEYIKICTKKDKIYCYFLTEYCSFTLRDYIDLRNEVYFMKKDQENATNEIEGALHKHKSKKLTIKNCSSKKITFEINEKRDYKEESNVSVKKTKKSVVIDAFGHKKKIRQDFVDISFTRNLGLNKLFIFMIMKNVLNGLLTLHSNKIIHGDLKPSNIFFNQNLTPKIGDFGLSSILDKTNNEYSDVKQIGMIYFEMLWPVKTVMERAILMEKIQSTKELPPDFVKKYKKEAKLITRCLMIDRDKKITVKKLLRKLDRLYIE